MNPRITTWQGRRVWLVGASAGIGAALARALSARGARLALSARNREGLEALGLVDALIVPCDVRASASVAAAWSSIVAAWSGVDLVIYLAGDYTPMTIDTLDLEAAMGQVDVNFLGALRVLSCVRHGLVAGGGLVLVASVAGLRGLPRALSYGPGKAALIHLAECLRFDWAPRGIGVWVVNPGFVRTRLTDRNGFAMPALISPEAAAEAMIAGLASGRFEIHFPKRFTMWLHGLRLLPDRLYFWLVQRFTGG